MDKDILKMQFINIWEMYLQEYFGLGKDFKIKKNWKPTGYKSEAYICQEFFNWLKIKDDA